MALDFPNNPVNNQVYDNFIYNATKGAWRSLSAGSSPSFLVNPTISDAVITATAPSISVVPIIVKGANSQSANLQEWKNSSGSVLASIDALGNITAGTIKANRNDSVLEGGEIQFMRSSDNAVAWKIDTYGSGTTPDFRIFDAAGGVRMQITNGVITMPYQPAFSATANYGTNYAGNLNPVVYGSVDINNGNNYNSSTGRFTAAIAGNYYFMSHGHRNANNGYTTIRIRKNGTIYANAWNASAGSDTLSCGAIINLAANDYVDVQMDTSQNNYMAENYWKFMGHLVG